MASPSNLLRVVASSVEIANRAGAAIRNIMASGNLAVVDKDDSGKEFDPQTEADRTAQRIIVGSLEKKYPGLCVIGEEDDVGDVSEEMVVHDLDKDVLQHACPDRLQGLKLEDLTVWVDPLDGTKEFTEGNIDHVTVLIGVSAGGRPVAGVVHQPFYGMDTSSPGRTAWAVSDLGVFGIEVAKPQSDLMRIATTKSHGNQNVNDTLAAMNASEIIRTGGAGYKVLLVLEGRADAYVFATPGCKKWDTCAPEALILAAGGAFTDSLNRTIDYSITDKKFHMNWTGVIVTLANHEYYASRVPEGVKANLTEILKSKTEV